jgi:hypothetical protein
LAQRSEIEPDRCGYRRAGGPAANFRGTIYYLAADVEAGNPASGLTEITMRSALRESLRDSEFVGRLKHAKTPFWVAVP